MLSVWEYKTSVPARPRDSRFEPCLFMYYSWFWQKLKPGDVSQKLDHEQETGAHVDTLVEWYVT